MKLEPLNVDLASTLPEISPNYKPLPYINPIHRKEEVKPIDDIIYYKNQRLFFCDDTSGEIIFYFDMPIIVLFIFIPGQRCTLVTRLATQVCRHYTNCALEC